MTGAPVSGPATGPSTASEIPDLAELRAAYAATRAATEETPLLDAPAVAAATGAAQVFVKPESLQWAGSFKVRGAYWRLLKLTTEERRRGVVAYSSGNFAQGLAAAGARQGVPVTIVMPADAPEAKRRATEGYGARLVLTEHGDRPREEVAAERARAMAAEEDLIHLHPFDDPAIVAGQAGAGLEAIAQLGRRAAAVDRVLCCTGGGGLIGGVALAFHYLGPRVRVTAVEPEGYDGMGSSLAGGAIRRVASGHPTICDALQATQPGAAPFAAARAAGVVGVAVSDAAVREAMLFAFEHLKLVLEPSGAVALAALLSGRVQADGESVLVYLTGGNVSLDAFLSHLGR
ncbi:MAG: pyridoxal-phosphate dependent enzyme [Paracoccaceae bacterium]